MYIPLDLQFSGFTAVNGRWVSRGQLVPGSQGQGYFSLCISQCRPPATCTLYFMPPPLLEVIVDWIQAHRLIVVTHISGLHWSSDSNNILSLNMAQSLCIPQCRWTKWDSCPPLAQELLSQNPAVVLKTV